MSVKTSDFYYELPPELIAQTPLAHRDGSRLLLLNRADGSVAHRQFAELPMLLQAGDCLVRNVSKVLPARLLGHLSGGGACELLLLKELSSDGVLRWQSMVRPGKKLGIGKTVTFGDGRLTATIEAMGEGGTRMVTFTCDAPFYQVLDELGQMPLPPYIRERLTDNDRYQTVYARDIGSAAAPTAGLHFTPELLQAVQDKGVTIADVTLHVGLGTFRPVKSEVVEAHVMHSERAILPPETAATINACRASGGRVIAVGTTVCRVLESFADENGHLHAGDCDTDIFITPGYRFRAIDGLITNFHLPESTLLMLVSALAGREAVLAAYRQAIDDRYRFFSFGDAMLIV